MPDIAVNTVSEKKSEDEGKRSRAAKSRLSCANYGRPDTLESLESSESPEEEIRPFVPSKAYATRKTVAQGALDFALLMANASQLKALVEIPANNRGKFYEGLITLLILSILLQIAAGLVLLILGMSDPKRDKEHVRAERLNNASVCLILLITVINVFISAFGISFVDRITDANNSLSS